MLPFNFEDVFHALLGKNLIQQTHSIEKCHYFKFRMQYLNKRLA